MVICFQSCQFSVIEGFQVETERPLVERIRILGRKLSQVILCQLRGCNFYLIHSTPMNSTLTFIQMCSKALFLHSLPSHPYFLPQAQFVIRITSVLGHHVF